MKKIIALLIIVSCTLSSGAQSDSVYAEIGINAIRLVGLGMNNAQRDPDVWNPYLLTAAVHYKRVGVRLGYGGRSGLRTELPSDVNGKTTLLMDSVRTDLRVGLEWEIQPSPRWSFKFGVDYFIANSSHIMETRFINEDLDDVVITKEISVDESGFAPFAYFQYHITPRISLGTELLWRFSNFKSVDSDVSNVSTSNAVRNYEGSKRIVMAPTALYLNVRF